MCVRKYRDEDQESHKHASRVFEERLENFKAQLAREREKSTKVIHRMNLCSTVLTFCWGNLCTVLVCL